MLVLYNTETRVGVYSTTNAIHHRPITDLKSRARGDGPSLHHSDNIYGLAPWGALHKTNVRIKKVFFCEKGMGWCVAYTSGVSYCTVYGWYGAM